MVFPYKSEADLKVHIMVVENEKKCKQTNKLNTQCKRRKFANRNIQSRQNVFSLLFLRETTNISKIISVFEKPVEIQLKNN